MTAPSPDRSICVHSAPDVAWFGTEVKAITKGVLHMDGSTPETGLPYLGSLMHALTRHAVWTLAERGEPFTVHDIFQVIERREIPIPEGTTPDDMDSLLRRLRYRIDPSSIERADTGGQP